MTPEEYIKEHNVTPLTKQELNKGKNRIKIFNTDNFMPWEEVYTRISAGMDMGHVAHIYGHGRKIALWAVHDKVATNDTLSTLLDEEIVQRKKIQALEEVSPVAANTLMDMANEYAPDVSKLATILSRDVLVRASNIVNSTDPKRQASSLDLVNIMKAQQMVTDSLGLTDRHASQVSMTQNNIEVKGFSFTEDTGKAEHDRILLEAIDAEVAS